MYYEHVGLPISHIILMSNYNIILISTFDASSIIYDAMDVLSFWKLLKISVFSVFRQDFNNINIASSLFN